MMGVKEVKADGYMKEDGEGWRRSVKAARQTRKGNGAGAEEGKAKCEGGEETRGKVRGKERRKGSENKKKNRRIRQEKGLESNRRLKRKKRGFKESISLSLYYINRN